MKWTEEETQKAIQMWREGYSASVISKAIGKSRGAVLGRLDRLKVYRPRKVENGHYVLPVTLPKVSV